MAYFILNVYFDWICEFGILYYCAINKIKVMAIVFSVYGHPNVLPDHIEGKQKIRLLISNAELFLLAF